MLITYSIQMDLKNRGMTPLVYAVQNEGASRAIALTMNDGGEPWTIPVGTTAAIRFRKSDGTGGIYDTLPDEETAYEIDGNKVTFYLAPQVLSAAGIATVQLVLMNGSDVLCSFGININVELDVSAGQHGSKDYVNLKNLMSEQIDEYFATHPDAGLSMLLLPKVSGAGVVVNRVYIGEFQLPDGYVPKVGDLVLHNDGYLGYIHYIDNEHEGGIDVALFTPEIVLKGPQGEPGPQGIQGDPGEKGEQGIRGEKGEQGIQGEKGSDGVSPTFGVSVIGNGHRITLTDANRTTTFDVMNGERGEPGEPGLPGEPGEQGEQGIPGDNGVSCTHEWNGTTLIVNSASGTSSANLKGEKGDKGDSIKGDKGDPGDKGEYGLGVYYSTEVKTVEPSVGSTADLRYADIALAGRELQKGDLIITADGYLFQITTETVSDGYVFGVRVSSVKGDKGDEGEPGAGGKDGLDGSCVFYSSETFSDAEIGCVRNLSVAAISLAGRAIQVNDMILTADGLLWKVTNAYESSDGTIGAECVSNLRGAADAQGYSIYFSDYVAPASWVLVNDGRSYVLPFADIHLSDRPLTPSDLIITADGSLWKVKVVWAPDDIEAAYIGNIKGPKGDRGEKGDVGGVATVNGVAPDENGNVQVETSAQADWNAPEGTPGHVLNRTHWVEQNGENETIHKLPGKFLPDGVPYVEKGTVEVLAECQPVLDEGDGTFYLTPTNTPTAGDICTVNWNGTEYVCVAQDMSAMMTGATLLGDGTNFGLSGGNGEPFAIVLGAQAGQNMGVISPLDGTTELTISIYADGKIYHKLGKEFLPPEALNNVLVVLQKETDENGNYIATHSFSEIAVALASGNAVFLSLWGDQYSFAGTNHDAGLAYFITTRYNPGNDGIDHEKRSIDANGIIQQV